MTIRRIMIFALIWGVATVGINFAVSAVLLSGDRALNDRGLVATTRLVYNIIEGIGELP